jgi:hypothetical protein
MDFLLKLSWKSNHNYNLFFVTLHF